jgi:hypothetical protein
LRLNPGQEYHKNISWWQFEIENKFEYEIVTFIDEYGNAK